MEGWIEGNDEGSIDGYHEEAEEGLDEVCVERTSLGVDVVGLADGEGD